jgi:hypothetical protein
MSPKPSCFAEARPEPGRPAGGAERAVPRVEPAPASPCSDAFKECTLAARNLLSLVHTVTPSDEPSEGVGAQVCLSGAPRAIRRTHWGQVLQSSNCELRPARGDGAGIPDRRLLYAGDCRPFRRTLLHRESGRAATETQRKLRVRLMPHSANA